MTKAKSTALLLTIASLAAPALFYVTALAALSTGRWLLYFLAAFLFILTIRSWVKLFGTVRQLAKGTDGKK